MLLSAIDLGKTINVTNPHTHILIFSPRRWQGVERVPQSKQAIVVKCGAGPLEFRVSKRLLSNAAWGIWNGVAIFRVFSMYLYSWQGFAAFEAFPLTITGVGKHGPGQRCKES
jgi:hypothetical protein